MNYSTRPSLALTAIALAGLAACGGGSGDSAALQPPDLQQTGFVSVAVSDSPVHDAEKVCISFDAIEFITEEDGPATLVEFDPPEKVNLLDFQGTDAAPLVIDSEVPAGDYEQLRLAVDASMGSNGGIGDTSGEACDGEASYLVLNDGSVLNLFVPSGDQTGLKLVNGYTVPEDGSVALTIEFDLMRSVIAPPGLAPDAILKPTLRLVQNDNVGALAGTVDSALATAEGCDPSVFLFADGVAPNPINTEEDDPDDPIATAMVNESGAGNGALEYVYEIGFLEPGDYEAAFTCDGETFEPEEGVGVTIVRGETTEQNF